MFQNDLVLSHSAIVHGCGFGGTRVRGEGRRGRRKRERRGKEGWKKRKRNRFYRK